jgi:hypothetical protein
VSFGTDLMIAVVDELHADAQLVAFMGKPKFVHNQRVPPTVDGRYITISQYSEDPHRPTYAGDGVEGATFLNLWTEVEDNMLVLEMYGHVRRVLRSLGYRVRLVGTAPDDAGHTQGIVEFRAYGRLAG